MDNTKPRPERFETYTLLPGGKSFTIKGCKFIFKIDRYGGWRDQYGNYYNSNGQPDFEPEDTELTPSEGSIDSNEAGDDYDEFQPDYDDVDDHCEEQSPQDVRNLEKISKNMEILSTYPLQKPLRVYFSNMPFKAPPKSVYEAYAKKVNGIKNIIFNLENNRRNGEGHFIMEDAKKAEDLVKLEGEKVIQREVRFDVEKLSDLIMDPIKESQLNPFWAHRTKNTETKEQKKDDIPRFKAAPAQKKQQQPKKIQTEPKKEEKPAQKQAPKQSQPKKEETAQKAPQQKHEDKIEFKSYVINFEIFPNPKAFYNWIGEYGFTKEADIKQVLKLVKDGSTTVTIQAKTSLAEKLNGQQYKGKEVKFNLV